MQHDNICSEKIYEGLTEDEALNLEHQTIHELLNNGYKLISDTEYFKYSAIIDYNTSNEKLLMNILDGGKDEQKKIKKLVRKVEEKCRKLRESALIQKKKIVVR